MKPIKYTLIAESLKSARQRYLQTDKISQTNFDELVSLDPSKTKKYIEWMCEQFLNSNDIDSIGKHVVEFDKATKTNFDLPSKDINYYRNLVSLASALLGFKDYATKKEATEGAREGAELLFENEKCYVYYIKTYDACKQYGKHTKWCITHKNMDYWKKYSENNIFLYFINKTNTEKYAMAVDIYKSDFKNAFYSTETFNAKDDKILIDYVLMVENISVDEFDEIMHKLQISFQQTYLNLNATKNADRTYTTTNNFSVSSALLRKDGKLGIKFKEAKSGFYIENIPSLKTLEGCPEKVNGDFTCSSLYNLTDLKYCPKQIGGTLIIEYCTKLVSLKGCPKTLPYGNFFCTTNTAITSLEGCPEKVNGFVQITFNDKLQTLKGLPRYIKYSLFLERLDNLTNLEGIGMINNNIQIRKCKSLYGLNTNNADFEGLDKLLNTTTAKNIMFINCFDLSTTTGKKLVKYLTQTQRVFEIKNDEHLLIKLK